MMKSDGAGPLKLLLVGDGPDRARLEKLASREGVANDVVFTGFIPRGDRVLKIFDVFVLPTSFEGCSNVLVEAMAKGLPILTTNVPSVCWMFRDGEQAILFRSGDAADLCAKLKAMASDLPLRRRLGGNALRNFHDRFEAATMIDKIGRIYEGLLSGGEPRS
jgi:glycosyltransferase involved in cell wall biosynthesis